MRARILVLALAVFTTAAASAASKNSLKFEDFPASGSFSGPSHRPILNTPQKKAYRTRIRAAADSPSNFAGEFVVTTWGCGTGCTEFAIVRPRTGHVYMPAFRTSGGETMYGPNDNKWERVDWRANSRLLIVNGKVTDNDKEPDAHHYYVFDGRELNYLAKEKGKPYVEPEPLKPSASTSASVPPTPAPPTELKVETGTALPPEFIGKWASKHAYCSAAESIETRIEATRLYGVEHECDFTKFEHVGDAWTVVADCEGEGDKWASRIQLSVNGDTINMQYDKQPQTSLLRCPEAVKDSNRAVRPRRRPDERKLVGRMMLQIRDPADRRLYWTAIQQTPQCSAARTSRHSRRLDRFCRH